LDIQKKAPGKKIGTLLVDEKKAETKDVIRALRIQKKGAPPGRFQVKVDTAKLDNLMDLTGELVIAQSMLHQNSLLQSSADQQLHTNLNRLTQIVSSLQKTAMSMRMVPIRNTFHKLVRLVRDLSKRSGKSVELEISGEETEIDRIVSEERYEPLVHMIRNAIDHGIEPMAERKTIGKPLKGTIRLNAFQRGGYIIMELHDDGRGIDVTAIRRQAISGGLIGKDDDLSETEVLRLIYQPGFSTAKSITDISGRGVGMDVVQNRIRKLRGRLALKSAPGKGCSVAISLPLTLAIIDGMVVRVEADRYIIPTLAITESFKPAVDDYHTVQAKGEMVKVHGALIPLIRLDQLFGVARDQPKPWEGVVVVVENNGKKGGLLLDELLRQDEIVVKSLGDALKDVDGIAGGAILGDGKVGLILDVEQLLNMNGSASKRVVT
jgi:two-component system chemotaxis sensor kinase CheA